MSDTRQTFHRAAGTYDAYAAIQRCVAANVADLALPYVQPHTIIADVGCGTGALASALPSVFHAQTIALDAAYGMCQHAHEHYRSLNVICADATSLPLASDSVHLYLSSLCLQWVSPLTDALIELKRVLHLRGVAIIALLLHDTFHELSEAFTHHHYPSPVLQCHTLRALNQLCSDHGLHAEITQHHEITHYHNCLHFLQSLKAIGATTSSTHPVSSATLRQIMRYYDTRYSINNKQVAATYHIAYAVIHHA